MKKLPVLVLSILLMLVTAYAELTDEQRVSMLIKDTAYQTKQADTAYNNAMVSIQSYAAGKPLYLIAEEVKEQNETLKTSVVLLANIVANRSEDIKNGDAKKALKAGVNGLFTTYNVKHEFLKEAVAAINSGSQEAIAAVNNKYSEQLASVETINLLAISELARAKSLVGLPADLNEFN